jgi:AP endonuclease-1
VGLGEIGLMGFQHIVRDERTKGLPIILETPSFDLPQEIWGVEIGVLGRLSLAQPSSSELNSDSVEKLTDEIKLAVNNAKRPAKAKRKRTKKK